MFSILFSLFNNICFFSYIKSKSFDMPLSSKEEKMYLIKMFAGDKQARDILITRNLRLVAHIAKRYENHRIMQEDLISIGTIGLMKAVDSYTFDKSSRLATYASRCIENEILMHLRATKKFNNEISLSEQVGHDKDGEAMTLEDFLKVEDDSIIDKLDRQQKLQQLHFLFENLSSIEQDVLKKRYGLFHSQKYTQNEIASEYGISRSYVSRIEKRALIKLYKLYQEK